MGVHFTIDVARKLVISTYSDELKDSDLLGVADLIKSHPDFDPSFSEIWDLSDVTVENLSTSAVQALARKESIFSPSSVHVAIAPQPHLFGLARMAQVYAEGTKPKVVVVQTMDQARKALGLD